MSAKVYVIGKSVSNAICSVSRRRRLTATTGFVQVQAFSRSQGNLCSFNETMLLFFYAILRSSFSLQKTTRALVCENIVWFKRYFDVNPIVWGVRETRHNVEVKSYKVVQVVRRMSFTRLKIRYILNWSLFHFPGTLVRFRRELKNAWDGVSKNNAIEHLRCWCTRFEDTRRNLKIPNLQ